MSRPQPRAGISINIIAPANNSNVSGDGSSVTYGFSLPTTGLTYTAKVVDGSNTYNGRANTPPTNTPPYEWGFSFAGVPTGVQVELTVAGTDVHGVKGSETIAITCTNP